MSSSTVDAPLYARHPFGLPLGSVRAFLSLLICGFFWMVLLWPSEQAVNPLLGHFFLLAMVLMAFSTAPAALESRESALLPWVLRILFVGGSVAVVAYTLATSPHQFTARLTPTQADFRDWWGPFMAITAGGFAGGLLLRVVLGRTSTPFLTLRSWLGLVGMLMLTVEFALFLAYNSGTPNLEPVLRYWQAVEVGVVAAYFGTRA